MSYDSVDVLAGFAEKRGITYPLLSDEGSGAIRSLGLFNQHVAEQHAHYGVRGADDNDGFPYPGTFVLDEMGVVIDKQFEQSYRVRPAGAALVQTSLGYSVAGGVRAQADSGELRATVSTGSPTYRPYQRLSLNLDLRVAPGLHIYGQPIPPGYTPVTVDVPPLEGMEVGQLKLPTPRRFSGSGLDEEFYTYEGDVRGSLSIVLAKNLGDVTLNLMLRYQACGDRFCNPPAALALELALSGLDLIKD